MWLQLQSVSFVIAQVEYIDRDHTGTHRQSESGNILILAPKIESGPARAFRKQFKASGLSPPDQSFITADRHSDHLLLQYLPRVG